jgi:hypothetical protein
MRILIVATAIAALVLAAWSLIALRRWTRLHHGQEILRGWEPAVVIPAQAAAAFLWLWMFFSLPWTFYILGTVTGGLWVVPGIFVVALLFILIPGSLVILDAAWLKLHPMAAQWTLGRIWGVTGLTLISTLGLAAVFKGYELVAAILGALLFFTVITWLFLTAWWVVSHPLPE